MKKKILSGLIWCSAILPYSLNAGVDNCKVDFHCDGVDCGVAQKTLSVSTPTTAFYTEADMGGLTVEINPVNQTMVVKLEGGTTTHWGVTDWKFIFSDCTPALQSIDSITDNGTLANNSGATMSASYGTDYIAFHTVNNGLITTNGTNANPEIITFTFTSTNIGGDSTAPTFDIAPSVGSITSSGFTPSASIDEGGTIYYIVVADGATAPTSAQVKAGVNYDAVTKLANGTSAVGSSPFTSSFSAVTGLSTSTAYDVYFVAEDDEGTPNVMASPTKVDVTTSAPANTAPTITGAVASQVVNDTATLSPFSNVTLADTENNNLSITITLDNNAKGVLSGTGLSGTGPYTLASDTIANVQSKLRALTFNPTDNRVAPASTETTTFTITANDGTDDSTPNNTTTVISTSINDAPTITSTPITTINEDSNYSYTLGATDVDGDDLNWSVKSGTSLPSWLSLSVSEHLVSTFAGSGTSGSMNGTGTAARFNFPTGAAVDSSGNIYVADRNSNKIRKITPAGVVSTLAGSGSIGATDGTGSAASFNSPTGVAVDSSGNVYVADQYNYKIRKITSEGVVSTLAGSGTEGTADGTGASASFGFPTGVAVDSSGNVYVADRASHKIRKVTPEGVVSTFAGSGSMGSTDGASSAASFNRPSGVAVDSSGNIYVADRYNHKIRKITPEGVVSTFAGSGTEGAADGASSTATFYYPEGVAVDSSGNVYVAGNNKIRKITPEGVVSTLAGSNSNGAIDGAGSTASFYSPTGVAVDSSGNVYVADQANHKIRKITPPKTTLIGTPSNADVGDYNITLVVSDGVNETEHNFTITVNNVNDAPSDITLSSNTIAENSVSGTTIGTFSTTDADSGDSATFSFCSGSDDTNFTIESNTLKSNSVFDYETKSSYSVCVRVTDSGSATYDKNITISITDVNENSGGSTPTPTPINGTCGSSNGSTLLLANITNITNKCSSGTAGSITDAGTTYTWSCSGTNGGATANCSVTKPIGTITNHIASTGVSGLTGTTSTTESDKEVLTATTTNNALENITIKAELPTDSTSEIKTKHSVTIGTKKTEAISKLEATVDIKSDKSVETKASKDTTDIVVTAKPDGTAEHTVTLSGNVVSKATSNIIGANTVIDGNGTVETMAGDVNTTQNGVTYTIKAVAETKSDGKTITKFVKVNTADETDVTVIGNTVLPTTPFEAGTNVIIDNIDGTLYIKTSAPLDENLVIE